jgi:hypothetical protein
MSALADWFSLAPAAEDAPAGLASTLPPEKALLLAVLIQALRDAQAPAGKWGDEARVWLESPDCMEICEWLDLSHSRIAELRVRPHLQQAVAKRRGRRRRASSLSPHR